MRKLTLLVAFMATIILVAAPVAEAKKPTTRARVAKLEKRVKSLTMVVAEQQQTIDSLIAIDTALIEAVQNLVLEVDGVYGCLLATGIDEIAFTLPGELEMRTSLSYSPSGEPQAYFATVRPECVDTSAVGERSGAMRSRALRVPR